MTLTKDGKPLPFGTTVMAGNSSSIVGDGGQVYLSGLTHNGTLTAKWGNSTGQSCRAHWHISDAEASSSLVVTRENCH